MRRTFVIAEAGVNHNGSAELAQRLVDVAAASGADAVKFQTFHAEGLVTARAAKARYQEETTGTGEGQLAMIKALELPPSAWPALARRAKEKGIELMSTPFDLASVDEVVKLGVARMKIASGEATNPPLLRAIARVGLPMILSTGMCTLGDIEAALRVLAGAIGERHVRERVTILHCTTEYPAPVEQANLRAMATIATAFGLPVGYSDHTLGIEVALAAVALGATVIEKHFTLDPGLPGPDHRASLDPDGLTRMVRGIRAVELSLGSAQKQPTAAEIDNMAVARRSLVAARRIAKGDTLTTDNLTTKRPGTGVSAMRYDDYLGRTAARDYDADDLIDS